MYENYCKLRDLKGLKDSDVARITGITKSTFSDWKSGRSNPKNEKLRKIADCLETTVDYLMAEEESGNVENKNKELKGVYFNFAKEMQEKDVSEADMQRLWSFYEMIQNARK